MKTNKIKKSDLRLTRPLKRSKDFIEIEGPTIIVMCIGFCNPPREFRALSKINKICPQCKSSERWRDF